MKNLNKNACKIFMISSENYTTHCWRWFAATNLADRSVSFINFKCHGQWKLDAVVEGYLANSKPIRREREMCLLPASLVAPNPSPPPVPNDIQTFTNLQGFSQLFNHELEVDHKMNTDHPLSQLEAKQHHNCTNIKVAKSRGMTRTLDVHQVKKVRWQQKKCLVKEQLSKNVCISHVK